MIDSIKTKKGEWECDCPLCGKELVIEELPISFVCPYCNKDIAFKEDSNGKIVNAQAELAGAVLLSSEVLFNKADEELLKQIWGAKEYSNNKLLVNYKKIIFPILLKYFHDETEESLAVQLMSNWAIFWDNKVLKLSRNSLQNLHYDFNIVMDILNKEFGKIKKRGILSIFGLVMLNVFIWWIFSRAIKGIPIEIKILIIGLAAIALFIYWIKDLDFRSLNKVKNMIENDMEKISYYLIRAK